MSTLRPSPSWMNVLTIFRWAIRNCGLLLLRGLMDNLFGTSESKSLMEAGWDGKASRLHYGRYPSLAPVLLGLLKSGRAMIRELTTIAAAEAVFPALDIVRRAGPPAALRDELQMYIADYLASPAWHVREIAARTLCSCMLHSEWLDALRSLLVRNDTAGSASEKNRFHGALMTSKFLVERLAEVMPDELTGKSEIPFLCRGFWLTKCCSKLPGAGVTTKGDPG